MFYPYSHVVLTFALRKSTINFGVHVIEVLKNKVHFISIDSNFHVQLLFESRDQN